MIKELHKTNPEQPLQTVLIRNIQPSDNPRAFWELHTKSMKNENKNYAEDPKRDYSDFLDPFNFYKHRQGDVIIAEADGKIVGFGAFMEYFEPTQLHTCYFRRLRVDPEYQNKGIGNKIIQARESLAASMGYEAARVITTSENKSALHLLLANGFKVIEKTQVYDEEQKHEVIEYLLEKFPLKKP